MYTTPPERDSILASFIDVSTRLWFDRAKKAPPPIQMTALMTQLSSRITVNTEMRLH